MRRAWNYALSQARLRRRRRWGVLFFWRLRLWTLAGTFPVPYMVSDTDVRNPVDDDTRAVLTLEIALC